MGIASISKRLLSSKEYLSPKGNLSQTTATADAIAVESFEMPLEEKAGKQTKDRWPNLGGIDLRNPNDVFTLHQLLIGCGKAAETYDSQYKTVLASVLACRLSRANVNGYFLATIKRGFKHPVTDGDHAAAKAIIRGFYD